MIAATIALEASLCQKDAARYMSGRWETAYKIPSPSNVTRPSLTWNFKFKFQNMDVEKTASPRSVAELNAADNIHQYMASS